MKTYNCGECGGKDCEVVYRFSPNDTNMQASLHDHIHRQTPWVEKIWCPDCDKDVDELKHEETIAYRVALKVCEVNGKAGLPYDVEYLKPEIRAANLVNYGYVREGDPHGWAGSPRAIATLYCEPRGGEGDVRPPFSYHDGPWPAFTTTPIGSRKEEPDWFWEWTNAAVAIVWPL